MAPGRVPGAILPPPTPVVPARADCPRSTSGTARLPRLRLRRCRGFFPASRPAAVLRHGLPGSSARGGAPAAASRARSGALRPLSRPGPCASSPALSLGLGARCRAPAALAASAALALALALRGRASLALAALRARALRFASARGGLVASPRWASSLAPPCGAPRASGPAAPCPGPHGGCAAFFPLRGPGLRLRARPAALARRVFGGAVLCRWLLPCAPPPRRPRWGLREAQSPKGLPSRSPVFRLPGAYPRPGGALRRR